MWTLAPSLVAASSKGWGELRSLATPQRWDLRPEDLPIVRALALGIPEADAAKHRELAAAEKAGWAARADTTFDVTVRVRLATLERHFAWCAGSLTPAVHAAILNAHAARRHLHRGYAQRSALPETIARRAALVGPVPKRVLLLGDDDFLSVGLVQLGHQVTVLEIEDAIAEHVRRAAPEVEVIAHDLREPFPTRLAGQFDVFFGEPVSGPGALRLFLARGLAGLTPDGQGFLCVGEASGETFTSVARDLAVDVSEQYTDFNHYYGPEYELASHTTDLVLVRPGARTTLKPRPDEPYLIKSLDEEDLFLETPATRYTFKNINPATSQIIHLDESMKLLEQIGRLSVLTKSYWEDGGVRSYLVHTKLGSAVFIRLVPELKVGELFVSPADSKLEDALITVLMAALGVQGSVVKKRRVRGSTVYAMV